MIPKTKDKIKRIKIILYALYKVYNTKIHIRIIEDKRINMDAIVDSNLLDGNLIIKQYEIPYKIKYTIEIFQNSKCEIDKKKNHTK